MKAKFARSCIGWSSGITPRIRPVQELRRNLH
jgi:hypothetical protein